MISDNHKKTAQWAMDYALKNGCQAARVGVYSSTDTSIDVNDTKIDKLKQASENALSIRLYVDGRYGNFSTNRIDRNELERFIKNGIESTRVLAPDEHRALPDASRYYQGGKPDLQLCDSHHGNISPDAKVEITKNIAAQIYGTDERIILVSSGYQDVVSDSYIITSNGFEGENSSTYFGASASVSVKGEGDARPSDGWYESAIFFEDLKTDGLGQKALQRVLQKLGQKKEASGKYTMVVDPLIASTLLNPMISALYGSSLQQRNSFLLDQLNNKVVSDKFTLIDNPHLAKSRGARYFDHEGVRTERRPVFENGILKTYYIDTYNASKMKTDPTISSPSILEMGMGDKNLSQIIAGIDKGILVTGFNGGNCNSTTGNFSYGIEGFLIEGGRLTQAVSEMNITGNMLGLWSNLLETGNDPRLNYSWRIPTLVFDQVDFSGS